MSVYRCASSIRNGTHVPLEWIRCGRNIAVEQLITPSVEPSPLQHRTLSHKIIQLGFYLRIRIEPCEKCVEASFARLGGWMRRTYNDDVVTTIWQTGDKITTRDSIRSQNKRSLLHILHWRRQRTKRAPTEMEQADGVAITNYRDTACVCSILSMLCLLKYGHIDVTCMS